MQSFSGRVAWISAILSVALSGSPAAADSKTVHEYLMLLDQLEDETPVKAAERFSDWSHDSIRKASNDYRRSVLIDEDAPGARRTPHRLKVAALLHTEAALLLVSDEDAFLHMDIARGFLDSIEEKHERNSTLRRWYLATGRFFQYQVLEPLASLALESALELDPDDEEVLLTLGLVRETAGWTTKSSKQLKRAEELYRKVIEIEPEHIEAKMRLAHVLALEGQHDEAMQTIGPYIQHLQKAEAFLILGDIYKHQEKHAKAVESYRRAAHMDPACQTAAIAHSHALYRMGDKVGARAVMDRFFETQKIQADDADSWWLYLRGDRQETEDRLDEIRKELLQ